ncbi:hypothetical protein [Actinacidiphila alni]|uniref:hypothetical protein n=1 Tax=Actinacidiphila alni TaxID=380248 RepID=UPI00116027A4|nr:hypothetical protein [Actinacidiphila alni]
MGLTATVQVFAGYGQPAQANGFSDWSCSHIPFADKVCATVEATNKGVDFLSDPMGYIAQFVNNAVTSLFTELIKALLSTTTIDWNDAGFLRTYSMAFAASTVLTVILWLIAVAKRSLQGVDPLRAATESVGYLLISVIVSALAPAVIAIVTALFDQAANAMLAPAAGDAASMVVTVTAAMAVLMSIPGGDVIVMFLGMAMLSAVAGVWMEMVIRNALILAGLVFGASVFSGLVDRDLWRHVRRWVGVMGAIIASKYVTFTTIALATGMLASDGSPSVGQAFATVFTAIALMWLALVLPFQIAKFLPLMGDEVAGMYQARDEAKGRVKEAGAAAGDTFRELAGRLGGGTGKSSSGGGSAEEEEDEASGAESGGADEVGGKTAQGAGNGEAGTGDGAAKESAARGTQAATTGDDESTVPGTRSTGTEPGGDDRGDGGDGGAAPGGEAAGAMPRPSGAASAPDAVPGGSTDLPSDPGGSDDGGAAGGVAAP